jgi:hypothetical protein
VQAFLTTRTLQSQAIAGQRLAGDDAADVDGEVGNTRQAARFGVKVRDFEGPARRLTTGMFAGDAIEPALDAAGQPEIGGIDGQDERAVDDTAIEPVGQDKLHALHAAVARRAFPPLVDPGELLASPMLAVADRGVDDGRLQARQRALEQPVIT